MQFQRNIGETRNSNALGPCAMCGKNLRKVSHSGPWVTAHMHQKCWKQEEHDRADREYAIITRDREEVFMRAMNGDLTVAIQEDMRQRFVALQEKYIASDINPEDPAQLKQFRADVITFQFQMRDFNN